MTDYGWDSNDAKKVWCFGPEASGPNFLVDSSSGVAYLTEIKDSIVAGFEWVSKEGVLAEENLRGVRINLLDATIH